MIAVSNAVGGNAVAPKLSPQANTSGRSRMSVFVEVNHVTTYNYHKPVEFSRHRVMFRPRAAHDIRVVSSTLTVSPHSTQYWKQDVFSNSVAVVEPRVPADRLELRARFVIEHFGTKNLE